MVAVKADEHVRYWAVVPAAGIGRRMEPAGQRIPKQYLQIRGRSILELTLERLGKLDVLAGIVLVLNDEDTWYRTLPISPDARLTTAKGGAQRAISVYNGLRALDGNAAGRDWVLVHDAVRPCVSVTDLDTLVRELSGDDAGGLLAAPVRETLKKITDDNHVESTVSRESYRLAGTPQMFRYGLLVEALARAIDKNMAVTDEAHAMELAGHPVRVVPGGADNIKITHPEDLVLAEFILEQQGAL